MRRIIVGILLALMLALVPSIPAFALTTADVTITATPEHLAFTNSTSNWTIGTVAESSTYWWALNGVEPAFPLIDGDMASILTNTGSVTSDVKIHGHDFTCAGDGDWALDVDGTPGADNVTIRYGVTGIGDEGSMSYLTLGDVEIVDSLAPASANHTHWCMEMLTGTFTAGNDETGLVTLTVFKHV